MALKSLKFPEQIPNVHFLSAALGIQDIMFKFHGIAPRMGWRVSEQLKHLPVGRPSWYVCTKGGNFDVDRGQGSVLPHHSRESILAQITPQHKSRGAPSICAEKGGSVGCRPLSQGRVHDSRYSIVQAEVQSNLEANPARQGADDGNP